MKEEKDIGIDIDLSDYRETIDDDVDEISQDRTIRKPLSSFFNFNPTKKILIWGIVFTFLIIIIASMLSAGNNTHSEVDLNVIQTKLAQIDESLQKLATETEETKKLLIQQMNDLSQQVTTIQQKANTVQKVSTSTKPVTTSTKPVTTSKKPAIRKQVSSVQKRYHIVRRGDNLTRIARKYGLPVKRLCRLNHISTRQKIHPGQKLIVGLFSN